MFQSFVPITKFGVRVPRMASRPTLVVARAKKTKPNPIHVVADRWRPALKRSYLASVRSVRRSINLAEVEAAYRTHSADRVLAAIAPDLAVLTRMILPLDKIIAESARAARIPGIRVAAGPPKISMAFNVTNPKSVEYIKQHTAELITEAADTEAIRSIIERTFVEGMAPSSASRLVRDVIGLTDAQSQAVANLYNRLINAKGDYVQAGSKSIRVPFDPDDEFLDKVTEDYSERLLDSRAEMIAHTESMRAANEGQLELWDQAVDAGWLTGDERKVWIATPDETACDECMDMDGETVGLDEDFSIGEDPPAHPNCRCTIGLQVDREAAGHLEAEMTEHVVDGFVVYRPTGRVLGGPGSGNFGHGGRPGEVGGSGDTVAGTSYSKNDLLDSAHTAGLKLFGEPDKYGEFGLVFSREDMTVEVINIESLDASADGTTGSGVTYPIVDDFEYQFFPSSNKGRDASTKRIKSLKPDVDGKIYLYSANQGIRIIDTKNASKEIRVGGGPGSGNFGHSGRPGEIGGSGDSVTPEQHAAIAEYVSGAMMDMNSGLRYGRDLSASEKEDIQMLDNAIAQNPLPANMTLYRIIPNDAVPGVGMGNAFLDKGFISTSQDQSALGRIADDIGMLDEDEGDTFLRVPKSMTTVIIQAPKGMGHLNINRILKNDSPVPHQKEVVLPRNTKFIVISNVPGTLRVRAVTG